MKNSGSRPRRNVASKYKGVVRCKGGVRWEARFYFDTHESIFLGRFDNEEDAARAYDEASVRYCGASAFLNLRDLESMTKP